MALAPSARHCAALLTALLAVVPVGCGGDDDDGDAPAPATTTQAAPPPTTAGPRTETEEREPAEGPRYRRTPASLADCIRAADSTDEVIVKGGDSEDATFFSELAGERVDVLGVTVRGAPAEVTVAVFGAAGAAKKAAPRADGGGVEARAIGSAVLLAPPAADTAEIEDCLGAAGYAGG